MRLLSSRSREVRHQLTSTNSVCARDLLADFPIAVIGSACGFALFPVVSIFIRLSAAALVVAGALIVWNGYCAWRTYFTKRNWVVALTPEALSVRIFRHLGPREVIPDPDVLQLLLPEVNSLSIQDIEIIWSSIRRTRIRCLLIEPKMRIPAELESFREYGCGVPKHQLATLQAGSLLLKWSYWYPALEEFLERASERYLSLSVGETQRVSFDLFGFMSQSELQQRTLLHQLKQLGFGAACVLMLRRRMRMSAADAARLINSL
jgi:hypothetical protein